MIDTLFNDDFALISAKYDFSEMKGKSCFITGATGLLGSQILLYLDYLNQTKQYGIKIFALVRSKDKVQKVFNDLDIEKRICFVYGDILSLPKLDFDIDYVIHGASITDSKTFIEKPVETIDVAIDGTRNLLRNCIEKNIKSFVYLSSLEIYGAFNDHNGIKNVKENDSGYIDCMNVRSSYSEGKRIVETICKAYQSEYNIPIKVARLCQTFGPGVDYNDKRVFAEFARAIIENRDIVLKTKGETVRNYCYTIDAVSGILTVLLKGNNGESYNIANMQTTISIEEMAKLFCNLFPKSGSKVIFDIAEDIGKLGYNPIIKLQLDTEKINKIGWKPEYNMNVMIQNLVKYMELIK